MSVETLRPLVAPSLRSGHYSPEPSGLYRLYSYVKIEGTTVYDTE